MKQSRGMSLLESAINIVVGFGIGLAGQMIFLPLLGVTIDLHQNLVFALIMTVVSIVRSYSLRRLFEALHIRHPISPFMAAVMAERRRQIEVEGWSAEHDDGHRPGELSTAGAAYAVMAKDHLLESSGYVLFPPPAWWPWSVDWWKQTGFRRDLVKACALIVADGEKHDRQRSREPRGRSQPLTMSASDVPFGASPGSPPSPVR